MDLQGKKIQAFYWCTVNYTLSSVIPSHSLLSSNEAVLESTSSLCGVLMKFEVISAVQRKLDIHFTRQKKNPKPNQNPESSSYSVTVDSALI